MAVRTIYKINVKRRNTLGSLDQYTALNSKSTVCEWFQPQQMEAKCPPPPLKHSVRTY